MPGVRCPKCQALLHTTSADAGRTVCCPRCAAYFVVDAMPHEPAISCERVEPAAADWPVPPLPESCVVVQASWPGRVLPVPHQTRNNEAALYPGETSHRDDAASLRMQRQRAGAKAGKLLLFLGSGYLFLSLIYLVLSFILVAADPFRAASGLGCAAMLGPVFLLVAVGLLFSMTAHKLQRGEPIGMLRYLTALIAFFASGSFLLLLGIFLWQAWDTNVLNWFTGLFMVLFLGSLLALHFLAGMMTLLMRRVD